MNNSEITKDLDAISKNIKDALFDAYKLGQNHAEAEKKNNSKKLYTDDQLKEQLIKSNRIVINKTVDMCKEAVKKCYTHYNYTLPDGLTKEQMDELVIKPYNYIISEIEKLKKMRISTK